MKQTLQDGSSYTIDLRSPIDRTQDLAFFHTYRNHKSASTPDGQALASSLLHSDVALERALPIPIDYLDLIIDSELCPLGIAKQDTVSAHGEIIPKHRACHDHTFPGPSGSSLNKRTDKTQLEPCSYGHCLRRILHFVHFLRLQHPDTPILLSKTDLDSAYRRMHSNWHWAVQCICIIGDLAYLLLRLPFGAAAAPAEFCVASEIVCDVANDLLADPTWDPSVTHTPYHPLLPSPALIDDESPFATALPLDVTPPHVSDTCCDVYIDDLITVGLYIQASLLRLLSAVAVAIHCIFRPLHVQEQHIRSHVLSLRKLAGEGQLSESKVILGWLINTRTFSISLPPSKLQAWTTDIQRLQTSGCTSRPDLDTLIGRLNHVGQIMPFARHFLHRLRRLKDSPWSRRTKRFSLSHLADLQLWTYFLSVAANGISINLLTYRHPDVTCWSDACLTGMGGYDSNGRAWRWAIPMELRGYLSLNLLEYLASIITIKLYLTSNASPYPCILSILDSTSAIGWLHKSSFDEATHSQHAHLARQFATTMLDHHASLFSQHIAGSNNIVADSLSRDFHIDSHTLSALVRCHFQVHPSFALYPLPAELVSWMTCLMRNGSRSQELKLEHTPSATWRGIVGSSISLPLTSSVIHSLTPLNPSTVFVPNTCIGRSS